MFIYDKNTLIKKKSCKLDYCVAYGTHSVKTTGPLSYLFIKNPRPHHSQLLTLTKAAYLICENLRFESPAQRLVEFVSEAVLLAMCTVLQQFADTSWAVQSQLFIQETFIAAFASLILLNLSFINNIANLSIRESLRKRALLKLQKAYQTALQSKIDAKA